MAARPRAPYSAPCHPDGLHLHSTRKITFRHPGYNDSCNIILVLPALDAGGIHHETARIACAICANNRWDGFFTATRTGPSVPDASDDVLRAQEYYFRVSDDAAERYPLAPSFAHWRFPHGDLPPSWTQAAAVAIADVPSTRPMPRQSGLTEALMARDVSCRITAHVEGTEHAHLIPRNEAVWFEENAMFRYANPVRPDINIMNDPRNAILLRSDIHTFFDQKRIALVPRSVAQPTFVVHVLAAASSPELVDLYHNVTLQPLYAVSIEYLFARFAWTIFAYTVYFMAQGVPRVLTVVQNGEPRTLELPGDQCKALVFPAPARSKSRSESPQKRKRDNSTAAEDDSDDEPPRGRKRRRSFEVVSSFDGSVGDHSTPNTTVEDLDAYAPWEVHATKLPETKVLGADLS